MRCAAIVLALLLAAVARAEDDDALLETPPLGEPIPERLQTPEKEGDAARGREAPPARPARRAGAAPFRAHPPPGGGPGDRRKAAPPRRRCRRAAEARLDAGAAARPGPAADPEAGGEARGGA